RRDVVEPALETGHALDVTAEPAPEEVLLHGCTIDPPLVLLLELVAVHGVVQEVGEVREEVQAVVDGVPLDLGEPPPAALPPFAGEARAVRPAVVGGVERPEAIDEPGVDGALRDLVGGVPSSRIAHGGQAQPVLLAASRVAEDAVELAVVV